jgi:hypothetical protein
MKVKEFIEYLQTLDQDKDIHIVYDCYYVFDPEVSIADEDWELGNNMFKYREGDYLIEVG